MKYRCNIYIGLIFVGVAALSGCSERSAEYYEAHPDEAKQVILECRSAKKNDLTDPDCKNANQGFRVYAHKKQRAVDQRDLASINAAAKKANAESGVTPKSD